MQDPLGYEGSTVVVTGAASGMGAATAELLVSLGADVTGLDVNEVNAECVTGMQVDLRDPASIDAAVGQIDGPIDSVFSCAGLPGAPFSELDTVLVNFVGARHFIEAMVPKLAEDSSVGLISSAAAVGWQEHIPTLMAMFAAGDFDGQKTWLTDNEELWSWSGYAWSKYAVNAWVGWRGAELIENGIRVNCINPGPTDTPMIPAFYESAGKDMVDGALGPIGRYSRAEEQAWPLVLLNSRRMSYVCGEVLWTDGGFMGALQTGRINRGGPPPEE
ncbi:SDR family oxidoreductase [Candidatus Poriferisocius sp.]|uniref:SDR family oxidoreductase n=1 Tax=Candidatus Poriferisocius sp. TaxID=3101276 RepID=UPI003B012B0B